MFNWWSYIINSLDKISLVLCGIVGALTLRKNKQLSLKNQELKQEQSLANKTMAIQNKVIDVTQNTKPTDFNGALERLRNDKL